MVCVKNDGCDDLSTSKIYRGLPDDKADEVNYIRVIDDSGEDYLYPASYFVAIDPPQQVKD